jgi:hypothetical protein
MERREADVRPGAHEVLVTRRGHEPFRRRLSLGAGGAAVVDAPLRPTGQRRAARWVLLSAAAALGASATTGAFGLAAQRDAEVIHGRIAPGRALSDGERGDYNDALARRDALRSVSLVLAGGAAALAVTGAALWWFDEPALEPALAPGMAGLLWRRRF